MHCWVGSDCRRRGLVEWLGFDLTAVVCPIISERQIEFKVTHSSRVRQLEKKDDAAEYVTPVPPYGSNVNRMQ